MSEPLNHPREEEAAAYVMGDLTASERLDFVSEMERDAVLRQLTEDLSEAAAALALTVPQAAPPAFMRDWVTDRVQKISQDGRSSVPAEKKAPAPKRAVAFGWAAAAALAIMSVVSKVQMDRDQQAMQASQAALEKNAAGLRAQNSTLKESLATSQNTIAQVTKAAGVLQQSLADKEKAGAALAKELAAATKANKALEAEMAVIVKSSELDRVTIASLESTVAEYKKGVAVVVWDGAKQEGILKLEKMPPVQANKDYQLWVVDPSKKAPVNAGVIRVNDKGFAQVQFKPSTDIQQAGKFALSVEKKVDTAGGVPENAGPIVLLGP